MFNLNQLKIDDTLHKIDEGHNVNFLSQPNNFTQTAPLGPVTIHVS